MWLLIAIIFATLSGIRQCWGSGEGETLAVLQSEAPVTKKRHQIAHPLMSPAVWPCARSRRQAACG